MIFTIIIFIGLIFLFCGIFLTKNMYKEQMKYVDKKEYKLKDIMPTSLYIMDKFIGDKIKSSDKVSNNILLIYGKREYKFRLRMYEAEKISLGLLGLIGVLFLTLILSLQNKDVINITNNTINKPAVGKGNITYDLQAQIEVDGEKSVEDIAVLIPETNPDSNKAKEILQVSANELPNHILGDNDNLNVIDKKVNLISSYPDSNIKIEWSIDSPYLRENGELRYNNISETGNEVDLIATLIYAEESIDKIIRIKVYPKTLTTAEKLELITIAIEEQLSTKNLLKNSDGIVMLPTEIEGQEGKISWIAKSTKNSTLKFLIIGVIIVIFLMILKDYEVTKKLDDRNSEIRMTFPECIIKLTLLLNAGMTLSRAWKRISKDYYDEVSKDTTKRNYLYEEMLETLQELSNGVSEVKAYEHFGNRCKIPEMMRFTTVIIQNIKKGNDTLVAALQNQANEAWDVRKNEAKKSGEKASSKLLIPMGIMFVIIIMIVMMPAFMSMGV